MLLLLCYKRVGPTCLSKLPYVYTLSRVLCPSDSCMFKVHNTNTKLMAIALSFILDPMVGIHSQKTSGTARLFYLLKQIWKFCFFHITSMLFPTKSVSNSLIRSCTLGWVCSVFVVVLVFLFLCFCSIYLLLIYWLCFWLTWKVWVCNDQCLYVAKTLMLWFSWTWNWLWNHLWCHYDPHS